MSSPLRLLALVPLVAAVLAGCGDDEGSTADSTAFDIDSPATVVSTTPETVFPTVATIGPVTDDTADLPIVPSGTADIPIVPSATSDIPVVPTTADLAGVPLTTPLPTLADGSLTISVPISVVVGESSSPDRVEVVPLGSVVSLTVVDDDSADEFHLHGYDLGDGQTVAAGQPATFTFTADVAGDFELESHQTGDVLFVLRVR
jgi:hypothetical protein